MFEFFSRKNEPSTAPSAPESQEEFTVQQQEKAPDIESETRGDHKFNDVSEFLTIDKKGNEIQLKLAGISDVSPLFDINAIDNTLIDLESAEKPEIPQEDATDNTPQKSAKENNTKQSAPEEKSPESSEVKTYYEITPQSEDDLLTKIKECYEDGDVFEKTHRTLERRNVPQEKMHEVMEHLFSRMAQKVVKNFKDAMKHELSKNYKMKSSMATKYIDWRLNTHATENTLQLKHGSNADVINAENFVSDELLTLYHAQQESQEPRATGKHETVTVFTSKEIDQLLDTIHHDI